MRLRITLLSTMSMYLLVAGPVWADPITFDCDVAANKYNFFPSITDLTSGPPTISGVIESKEFHSGQYLPAAGALLRDAPDQNYWSFQIFARYQHARYFDIKMNSTIGGRTRSKYVGKGVSKNKPVPFSLTLQHNGTVHLQIADQSFYDAFVRLPKTERAIFCSSGHFKFSEVRFGSIDSESSPHRVAS